MKEKFNLFLFYYSEGVSSGHKYSINHNGAPTSIFFIEILHFADTNKFCHWVSVFTYILKKQKHTGDVTEYLVERGLQFKETLMQEKAKFRQGFLETKIPSVAN